MNQSTDARIRSAIEAMREQNERIHGKRDTHEIDRELAGQSLIEQFKAWRELANA
jgi:hypothetical protein